jgi:hypothetical protein
MVRQTARLGIVALILLISCGLKSARAYEYEVPDKIEDGWETASLSSEKFDATAI